MKVLKVLELSISRPLIPRICFRDQALLGPTRNSSEVARHDFVSFKKKKGNMGNDHMNKCLCPVLGHCVPGDSVRMIFQGDG